ncbi:hypothetical protein Scep_006441 [Stephania cephalantha]|uniref:Uncharacterized protein n=1 Tax=Stephania cephalantha TaxID=152367 RepID=A0AAP0PM82_9MAGN
MRQLERVVSLPYTSWGGLPTPTRDIKPGKKMEKNWKKNSKIGKKSRKIIFRQHK